MHVRTYVQHRRRHTMSSAQESDAAAAVTMSRSIDYATLYEERLPRYEKAKENLKNGDRNQARERLSASMASRASFAACLQCATIKEPENAESLEKIWNQTDWEMDSDAGGEAEILFSLESDSIDKTKRQRPMQDTNDDREADVDAFFHDYPECVGQDCEDSDSDESDDEVEIVQPPPRKVAAIAPPEPSPQASRPAQPQDMEVVVIETQIPPSQAESHFSYTEPAPASMPAPQNPYMQQQASHQVAPQPSVPTRPQQQAGGYNNSNNNAAWDSFRNQQNPFQSARELAQIGGDSGPPQNDYQSPNEQAQYNPYARQPPAQPQQQLRGPNIPNSLKRKFQPPKRGENQQQRGSNSNQGTNSISNKKKGAILSNGGGNLTSNPSNSSDDDELPEALKGLDKELIEKIQNEIMESGESVSFDDIAGLADAKQTVRELVCWPMKRPDLFTGLRRGPNGLLLFGPPGTGKTLIGKAIAFESKATFFSISSSSLTSKWIGEGEKLVRTLFAVAAYREPAVVFIDEIDSLLTQRKADENEASRRIKTEFLVQLDGTGTSGQGRVLVIGATNRPHELDDAARRRFVKRLYVPLPAQEDRQILLQTLLKKNRHVLENKCFVKLSKETEGFSGADLKALCTEAAMGPIRQLGSRALEVASEDVPPIAYKHFRQALRGMHPSVAQADLDIYIEWNKTYGNQSIQAYDDNDEDSVSDDD